MNTQVSFELSLLDTNYEYGNSFYLEFYSLWRSVWDEAFIAEFNLPHRLPSDKFTSQDIVIGIRESSIPVALITLRRIDLDSVIDIESSSLIFWPPEILTPLKDEHRYVYCCENLSIDPLWRKTVDNIRLKDLLFILVRLYLLDSKETGIVSCVRNFRSVQLSSYESGAIPLLSDQIHPHIPNQKVDYVFWDKFNLGEVYSRELLEYATLLYHKNKQGQQHVYQGLRELTSVNEVGH